MNQQMNRAEELGALLQRTRIGEPRKVGNLTVVPLLADDQPQDAVLLEEAQAAGSVQVAELDNAGRVNTIEVTYSGDGLLLLLDGEEVVGAKQNRVFNTSLLVPPGAPVQVPVSCVEQGRWRHVSDSFTSAGRTLSSRARARKLSRLSRSVVTTGAYDADQSAVWQDVDEYITQTGVESRTQAFSEAAEARSAEVEQHLARLIPEAGQHGLAAIHDGRVVALDLFGAPSLYRRAWRKVARGLLLQRYPSSAEPADPAGMVGQALAAALGAPVARQEAPGAGQTLHGEQGKMALGAVVHGSRVYHAFAASSE